MKLIDAPVGSRFQITGLPDLTGVVVAHGPGSTTVDYSRTTTRTFEAETYSVEKGREKKTVTISNNKERSNIAHGTEVTLL